MPFSRLKVIVCAEFLNRYRVVDVPQTDAIGATSGNVLRMIVREGFMLTGLGLAVGLVGSLALTRLLHSLVFGVSTLDAFSFTAGVAVLATASLAATLLPARRAARLEPLVALHED